MKKIETNKCYDGTVEVWEHESSALGCPMRFSIFLPPQVRDENAPLITFLSGLTCTHDNFTTKAGAYKCASQLGLAILAPDTSPRGDDVPNEDTYDFAQGAGFYINATQAPWNKSFQMESYIAQELPALISKNFDAVDTARHSIMGHSMGGHGALTLYFKYPDKYKSASAFSPIVAPAQVPWGKKAFTGYLGDDQDEWLNHDATALVARTAKANDNAEILIDQGLDDQFLDDQLKPHLFAKACQMSGQKLQLRQHEGYDHSYYFIQSFIDDHLHHHAQYLRSI